MLMKPGQWTFTWFSVKPLQKNSYLQRLIEISLGQIYVKVISTCIAEALMGLVFAYRKIKCLINRSNSAMQYGSRAVSAW